MKFLSLLKIAVLAAIVSFLEASAPQRTIGAWRPMKAQGTVPIERPYAACAVFEDNLFVYGGRTGVTSWSSSVHKFNLDTSTWGSATIQPLDTASKLPNLAGHSFTRISETEWIVFGGRSDIFTFSNDLYLVDLKKETSVLIKTGATSLKPSPRWEHASAHFEDSLYVFGGTSKESFNDIFAYNFKTSKWSVVTPTGDILPHIYGHTSTVTNGKIYLIGGYLKDDIFNPDVYVYDIQNNALSRISNSGLKPRAFHTASLIGNYIYVIGGVQTNDNLVEKVQILHTLKDQVIEYPIAGKFPSRKNHCGVVDEKNRSVVIFGGISAKRWGSTSSRNDVVVLETSPETRATKDAPLTHRLDAILLDINSEIFNANYTDASTPEQQLLMSLEEVKDSSFDNLPTRISDCKEIELLYHEMVNSDGNRRDIVGQSKLYIEEIRKISQAFVILRDQLQGDAVVSAEKLKRLTVTEHHLTESQQLHEQAKQDEARTRELKQAAKKRLAVLQGSIIKIESQIASFESKRISAMENLRIYNNMLKTSDGDFLLKQDEERAILDKLRELQIQSGNFTSEIESLRSKILRLQKSIHDTESHMTTLRNLPIEQMRNLFATGDHALKQLLNMIEMVLRMVPDNGIESPGGADIDQLNPDRLAAKITDQITVVQRRLTMEMSLLEKLKGDLSSKNKELDFVSLEITKWKRKHEEIVKAINQINVLKTDSDKKRAELEYSVKESNDNMLVFRAEFTRIQAEITETTAQADQLAKDEQQHARKKEEEVVREAKLQKEIRFLRGELEDIDSDLRRKFQEALDLQRDLAEMRTSITVSKELFDQQRASVNGAREKLRQKLKSSGLQCITCEEQKSRLEKEVEALKKRIAQLEKA